MTIGKALGAGTPGIESGGACAECLWGCETISRNDTVLVKYAYLADGMKASALTGGGAGLVYRGSMTFRRDSTGVLSFESAPIAAGRMTANGARHYSPSLRRWLAPDPLSEKYYDVSPYAYCAGDPVNAVDVEGRTPWVVIGSEQLTARANGEITNYQVTRRNHYGKRVKTTSPISTVLSNTIKKQSNHAKTR